MKLDLPASISVHPVFNVSLLKNYYGDILQPKTVQVEDDVRIHEIDSIYITEDVCVIDSTFLDGRGTVQKRTCGSWKQSWNMHKSSCNITSLDHMLRILG